MLFAVWDSGRTLRHDRDCNREGTNRMKLNNTKRFALVAVAAAVGIGSFAIGSATADDHSKDAKKSYEDKKQKDIVAVATSAGQFNTLAAALKAADLVEVLKSEGPFTVFAPTDEAFEALPSGTLDELLKPENKEQLQGILLYHVVKGKKLMASDVVNADEAETAQGEAVQIEVVDGNVMLNDTVMVTKTDIAASNGVIHVIDGVLIPLGGNAEDEMEEAADDMGM